jgi:PAS domain S-box-containing protein
VLAFNRDISERRAAEAKVRESEEKFRSLTEASSDYIMRYDRQGRHTYMNPAGIQASGLTAAELIGKTHRESGFPEHLCEQWEAKIQQVFATAAPAQLEFEWASSTGPVTLDLRFTPEFDAAGQVFSVLGVSRDITERKQAEQALALLQAQLQQTQKMESLGSLAGGVAHDMNNVLGAILGLATAHLEIQPPGGPAFRAFDTISKAALRGGKLVKGLLTFARQSPAEDRELDMNTLLREEVRLLERTTLSKVHLELDLAPGLRPIRGDASALTHAFMNLCVNAVDAMSASGTLTLRTRNVDNDWIEVVVEDTGSGMPQEVLDKALEPFFTTKGVGKGTGLGLSMVYSTVKAHRGQLQLQSEPGRGTCVTLRVPAWRPSAPEVEPEAVPVAAAVLAPSARSLRVLVVDDDELVQSSTVALLTLLGHSATAVFSGEAALVELDAGLAADLVILDMNMPGLGGAGTLPRLRARRPTLPVLLSTGRADQTALDLVQAHPHVTLLPKPFSMKDLQAYLDALPPSAPPEPSPAP